MRSSERRDVSFTSISPLFLCAANEESQATSQQGSL